MKILKKLEDWGLVPQSNFALRMVFFYISATLISVSLIFAFLGLVVINSYQDDIKYIIIERDDLIHKVGLIERETIQLRKHVELRDDLDYATNLMIGSMMMDCDGKDIEIEQLKEDAVVMNDYIQSVTGKELLRIVHLDLEITKYTNAEGWWEPGDPNYGRMASGNFTYDGAVAMPSGIPFGSQVLWDDNIYTVEDRGSAIKVTSDTMECRDYFGMDIYTSNLDEALDFGRQRSGGHLLVFAEEYDN